MKRLTFAVLFAVVCLGVYAQSNQAELIGSRIKYVLYTPYNGRYCNVDLTDVYQDNFGVYIHVELNIGDIFDFSNAVTGKFGTANLYSPDFERIITQYIRDQTASASGRDEWYGYAPRIAKKISDHIKAYHQRH